MIDFDNIIILHVHLSWLFDPTGSQAGKANGSVLVYENNFKIGKTR